LGLSLDSFGLDSLGLDALGFDAWQAFMWASDRIYGSSYGDYSFHRRREQQGSSREGQAVPGTERAQQATGMQGGSFRGGQELGCDGGGVSARHMGVLPLAISQGEAQQMAGGSIRGQVARGEGSSQSGTLTCTACLECTQPHLPGVADAVGVRG
ncbi:hypothetical protein CLOM_g6583, partial [Closterium sp. NIES-68]